MTMANTFAAKLSVAFVAIAMALSMVAPAQAQTAEELQAQIDTLMATIASLQGQLGVSTPVATGNAYVFTRDLTIGSTGADVTALQNYLIGAGFSIPAGATGYFGSQTQAAVAAWQTANGVMPAAGYFGPVSQAKYTALVAVSTPTTPDEDEDEDEDDEDTVSLSGEASLGDVESNDGDDTELEEGQEAAPVAEFEVEFDNGDALISRVDITLENINGTEDAWDTFEEVSLWVDGDEIASVAADDEDDYLSDEKTLRISGLDLVAMEDEPVTIVVAVTVAGTVDESLPVDWEVNMTEIRYVDADDVTSTDDTDAEAVEFSIDEEGGDDEIVIKTSSEDPDATTLQLDDNGKSDWLTVFAFDIDTDDSTNDIELTTIPVTITLTGGATFGSVISDMRLVIDGEEFDDWSYASGVTSASSTGVILFDIDGDLVIDAGDRVTAELEIEFKQLAGADEGDTIQAEVTSGNADDIEAEGADDLGTGQLDGSALGDEHTLRSSGAVLELASTSETLKANTDSTTADDEGVFVLKFDVTAFEQDLFIAKSAAASTTLGVAGVNYVVEDSAGAAVGAGTSTASLSSNATSQGSYFKVAEGETKTFTLTVNYDPATSGFYQVQLHSVAFAATAVAPTTLQEATPAEDFETDQISI